MLKKIISVFIVIILIITIVYFCCYNKEIIKENSISTDKKYENIIYNEEKDVFAEDIIGTLIIEKIGLTASIKEGSTSEILKNYIGHIEETAIYDGNVGLAAHNRGNRFSYFARINELNKGDKILYKTKYGNRQYIVDNKQIILETQWELLKDTNENKLSLITCIKNKKNQRLCIQAIQDN